MTSVSVHASIADIGQERWDSVAGSSGNPFVSFDFLDILEQSGCVGARTGWSPCHLAVEDEDGATLGVMPLYLKSHSQGEYVFDYAWADAYERAGGQYYPKLQCASPFSPVTGPRLIGAPEVKPMLLAGALELCTRVGASSLHVTFPEQEDWDFLGTQGLLRRQDRQYHWRNQGYGNFEDFLGALSSSHRKIIRRERREAQDGVEILALSGADLTEAHWDAFFAFYMDTGSRKWGRPYLNRRFFSLLNERMADKVLLLLARREGRFIAGALNLIGDDCLYGRHWGAVEHRPFLHFELCYYRAIEEAIRLGLARVEAGAQGDHKISRGYLPEPVYSAHWIADPGLREPVARYLREERRGAEAELEWLADAFSPFRRTDSTAEK